MNLSLKISFLFVLAAAALEIIVEANTYEDDNSFPYKKMRLPKHILPESYKLHIKTADMSGFEGSVAIDIRCYQPTKQVILHSRNLVITSYSIIDLAEDQKVNVTRMLSNETSQQILLETAKDLDVESKYRVLLKFQGSLSNTSKGFYRSSYTTQSKQTKYMAATQFMPTYARTAFPCFDEPEFKAVFTIIVTHEKKFHALSNMAVEETILQANSLKETHFQPSKKISTFQVAIVISEFYYRERTIVSKRKNTKIRFWATPEHRKYLGSAITTAVNVLVYFEKFFGFEYPLSKLDVCALPGMENTATSSLGLITVKADKILDNPSSISIDLRYLIPYIISTSISMQWFGNLVTMKWWDELWINQGLSIYMGFRGYDYCYRNRKVMDYFALEVMETLKSDGMVNTHPLYNPVSNAVRMYEYHDEISYVKGAAIFHMLHEVIGESTFSAALENYLWGQSYDSTEAKDFWNAFGRVSHTMNVQKQLSEWVYQKGYPIVFLDVQPKSGANTIIKTTQIKFLDDATKYTARDRMLKWNIPLFYITSVAPDDIPTEVWMNKSPANISVPSSMKWIKANAHITNFYRVHYSLPNWQQLIQQLNKDHLVFREAADRANLIDDALVLADKHQLPMKDALKLVSYISKERSFIPLLKASKQLFKILNRLITRPSYDKFKEYIMRLMRPVLKRTGYQNTGYDDEKRVREYVIWILGVLGDKDVIKNAKAAFQKYMANERDVIPPHLRIVYYITAIKHGGVKEWQFLRKKYETTHEPLEKQNILLALPTPSTDALRQKFYNYALTEIHPHELILALRQVQLVDTPKQIDLWKFVIQNFERFYYRLGIDAINTLSIILQNASHFFNTQQLLKEVHDFVKRHPKDFADLRTTEEMLEGIRTNIRWLKINEKRIDQFLANN